MRIAYQNVLGLSLPQIAEIQTACYGSGWTSSAHKLAEIFRVQDADLELSLVAYDGRRPMGIAILGRRRAHGWLYDFAVSPSYRGQGVGTRLLTTTAREAAKTGIRDLELDVWEKRSDAIRLYERAGFKRRRTYLNFEGSSTQLGLATYRMPAGWAVETWPVETVIPWYAAASGEPEPCWDRRLPSLLTTGDALACSLDDERGPAALMHYAARPAEGRDPNRIRPMFVGLRADATADHLRALMVWAARNAFGSIEATAIRVALEPEGSRLARVLDEIGMTMAGLAYDMRYAIADSDRGA